MVIHFLNRFRKDYRRLIDRCRWILSVLLFIFTVFIKQPSVFAQSIHTGLAIPPYEMAELYLFQKRYNDALRSFHQVLEKGESNGYIFRGLVNA